MLNCEDGNIFHAIGEYCIGESNGTINSTDEFLKFYGNGDADKGMAVIKKRLDKENYLTRKIANSKNASDEAIEKTKKEFIDYLEKERSE